MVAQGIMRAGRSQKIAGNELRALVDELIKSMLAVGARLAPDDGAGGIVHETAVRGHGLAVAFHVALLKIGGEPRQILVVGQDGVGLGAEVVAVPDAEQAHDDRDIFLQRRGAEMLVGHERPFEKLLEVVEADGQGDGKPDGRPQGIPAAHPVPEHEHVGRIDAEFGHGLGVGGKGHEMLGHGLVVLGVGQKPRPGRMGVGHGFQGGERLGGDDEKRRFRVDPLEGLGQMGAVHVGDEMGRDARHGVVRQGEAHHLRPEVRAADADIDHISNFFARVAGPLAGVDATAKPAHLAEHPVDLGHGSSPGRGRPGCRHRTVPDNRGGNTECTAHSAGTRRDCLPRPG